jgi:hypothetical protein
VRALRFALVAAVVVAVPIALFSLRDSTAPSRGASDTSPPVRDVSGAKLTAPARDPRRGLDVAGPGGPDSTSTSPQHSLVVTVEGLDSADDAPARFHVAPQTDSCIRIDGDEVEAFADPRRPMTLDLTGLVRRGERRSFVLSVEHPRAFPVTVRDVAVPAGSSRTTTRVAVHMVPAAAIVGRLVGGRSPLRDARVSAHRIGARGPMPTADDSVEAEDSGEFRLRVAPGSYALVALVDGYRPTVVRVAAERTSDRSVGDVVLDPGRSIRGTLDVSGVRCHFVTADATPSATTPFGAPSSGLAWAGEELQRTHASARVEAGRFEIRGLAPGSYRVHPSVLSVSDAHSSLASSAERTVVAGAEDVALVLRASTLVVEGEQPADETLSVEAAIGGAKGGWLRTGEWSAQWTVPADRDAVLAVRGNSIAPYDRVIRAAPAGETARVVVRTTPRGGPTGRLRLRVVDGEDKPVRAVRTGLFREGDGAWSWSPLESQDGTYDLRLPLGTYHVDVESERGWDSYRIQAPDDLVQEVRANEPAEARVELRRGGCLEVRATDSDGHGIPAECRIRPVGGEWARVEFVHRAEWGLEHSHLSGLGFDWARPALSAGRYEIHASLDGFAPTSVEADVVAGETRQASIVLAPR